MKEKWLPVVASTIIQVPRIVLHKSAKIDIGGFT
jgi:hypothetical protein